DPNFIEKPKVRWFDPSTWPKSSSSPSKGGGRAKGRRLSKSEAIEMEHFLEMERFLTRLTDTMTVEQVNLFMELYIANETYPTSKSERFYFSMLCFQVPLLALRSDLLVSPQEAGRRNRELALRLAAEVRLACP